MSARKVYARLALTEEELAFVKSAVTAIRAPLLTKQWGASSGPEQAFYDARIVQCEAILAKIEAVYRADRSQDAEPDDAEDDAEEADA